MVSEQQRQEIAPRTLAIGQVYRRRTPAVRRQGIARSSCYDKPKGAADDTALVEAMHAIKDPDFDG